jgi:chemotaxis protein methyltransferase CheR
MRSHLRRNVVFSQHNLAIDQAFNEFHLVMCRNVNIYFAEPLQQKVLALINQSLAPFGVLVLGKKETLRGSPRAADYDEIVAGHRIYKKRGK